MPARMMAASALAALLFAGAPPSRAADLGYGPYTPRDRADYYDPRYAEAPPAEETYRRRGDHDDGYDYPRRGSVKDGYPEPVPAPHARDYDRYPQRHAHACASPHQIVDGLRANGWKDFDRYEERGPFVFVKAERRHGGGRDWWLKVDRCTGQIVEAVPRERGFLREFGHDHHERYGEYHRNWR